MDTAKWEDYLDQTENQIRLGCGDKTVDEAVNVDRRKQNGVDVVTDLTDFPWPFKDSSFKTAVARDLIEHIPPHYGENQGRKHDLLILFFEEVYRILEIDGLFCIQWPIPTAHIQYGDVTHYRQMNPDAIRDFCVDSSHWQHSFETKARFEEHDLQETAINYRMVLKAIR